MATLKHQSDLMTVATFDEYGPPEVIRLAKIPAPTPGSGEVLIRTHSAAINPIDCMTRAGFGLPVERFPGVLGWDVAGTVVATGPDVTELRVGDAVFGMPRFPQHVGCCAEYVISPATTIAVVPAGVSMQEAAAAPMATLTAWQALQQWPEPLATGRVLIHGAAGGVGHIAVQLAKGAGAQVIATASARNHDFLRTLGADEVFDYMKSPFEGAIHGIDLALDTRGGAEIARLIQTLKPGGMVVSLKDSGDESARAAAAAKNARVLKIVVHPDRDVLTAIGERLQNHSLKIEIASEFPLAEIAHAHALVESGGARGKVVLRVA